MLQKGFFTRNEINRIVSYSVDKKAKIKNTETTRRTTSSVKQLKSPFALFKLLKFFFLLLEYLADI